MYPYNSLLSGRLSRRSITAAFGAVPRAVINKLLEVMETYRQRRALDRLDDRLLKDIGLNRCDVERELTKPLWR